MDDFIADAPLPAQRRWLGRIQQYFAVCYAGAAQAIDYKILPWRKKATRRAIKACMYEAMERLIATELDTRSGPTDEALLTQFKRRVGGGATFVRLDPSRRKKSSSRTRLADADGIVRSTKSGNVECLLFARTLAAWFPEVADRNRLAKLLRSRRIFKRGRRSDTNSRQVQIAELGRVPCYGLSRKRLRATS